MPSLRRTISSPSVRSSPYPTSLSNASHGGGRVQGHGQRRSSGSETGSRRVLADIEWWRVADGQRDLDAEQESEERDHDHPQVVEGTTGRAEIHSSDAGAERPSPPSVWTSYTSGSSEPSHMLSLTQFAALSITPHSPSPRRHTPDPSSPSLESTPEAAETPLEGLHLGMADLDLGFSDMGLPALPTITRAQTSPFPPFLTVRSHSFTFLHDDAPGQYADFTVSSPLSSHSPNFFN